MLHSIDPSILFLKEEELIKAGALDMKMTLETSEEVYRLLGEGKILCAPKSHMSMPINSGDNWQSFCNAMPCCIEGGYNIAGVKWASESKKNSAIPGIPYGIDITILTDPETVLPFCILDGTLITAMRTAAVAGIFAKYTASKNTDTVTIVGAGVIGRTLIMAVNEALPGIKKIYLADIDLPKAEKLAAEYKGVYPAEIIPTADSKTASLASQVVITATTARKPFIDKSWMIPGISIINMCIESEPDVVTSSGVIAVDCWDQLILREQTAVAQLHKAGKLEKDRVVEISDMVLGRWPGRADEKQVISCSSLGLGALDVLIGYKLFLKAQEMGLGTTVKLWDKPLWE